MPVLVLAALLFLGSFDPLCRIINKRCNNGSCLLQVGRYKMIVGVHIGMMCAGIVFNLILYKLKPGNTYCIKCKMICTAGIVYSYSFSTQVFEWLKPFRKNRTGIFISL